MPVQNRSKNWFRRPSARDPLDSPRYWRLARSLAARIQFPMTYLRQFGVCHLGSPLLNKSKGALIA